jgi:hypothetical protein
MNRTTLSVTVAIVALVVQAAQGDLITDLAASAPRTYPGKVTTGYWAILAVDGTGLAGGDHDTTASHGWLTPSGTTIDDMFFVIDLKKNYVLDATSTLKYWNGDYSSGSPGMRAVSLYTSTDGIHWGSALAVTFKDRNGVLQTVMTKTSGTAFDGTIDFNSAVTARYVKIDVNGGQSVGNYGTAGYVSLAEVQAFGTVAAKTPSVADKITPASVSCTGPNVTGGYGVLNAVINGAGLSGEQHDQNLSNEYMTSSSDGQIAFTFDLGSSQKLGAMKIWNFNEGTVAGYSLIGMRTVDILVSNDAITWETAYDNIELTQSTGKNTYDNPFLVDMRQGHTDGALSGANYQYVQISSIGNTNPYFEGTPLSGYAGGLAEVQFFQTYVPEPATIGLLALGSFGIASLRLRRRRV